MPTYEYTCKDCGALTSVFTRTTGFDQAVSCERCGSANTARAISMFAFPRAAEPAGAKDGGERGFGGGYGHGHGGGFGDDLDMGDDF